jgi:hypothetical protein
VRVHGNQAILAAYEGLDVRAQVSWLARALEARAFPLDRLARDLELAADVTREQVIDGSRDRREARCSSDVPALAAELLAEG